ncbi:flagellar export protein FliJ [Niveibacterium sp. SC-1]|uniref:flagellar export protein FliJ n=1 Tax=Niveibacterium sp. SC-1 TaxID=3135646 RepID=UPI00311D9CAE
MTKALETLIELAKGRMDDAAKKLGGLLASARASDDKLKLLTEYRNEYRERFKSLAANGIGPEAWRNYSTFLGKLEEAIVEQQRLCDRDRAQVAMGQQAWVDERNRKMAFDTLVVRQQKAEIQRQNRSEQKMTDEHSAKLFRRTEEDNPPPPSDE